MGRAFEENVAETYEKYSEGDVISSFIEDNQQKSIYEQLSDFELNPSLLINDTTNEFETEWVMDTTQSDTISTTCDDMPNDSVQLSYSDSNLKNFAEPSQDASSTTISLKVEPTDTAISCKICLKSFKDKKYLNAHTKAKHGNKIIYFECCDCGKKISSKYRLEQHYISHNKNLDQRTLEQCKKETKNTKRGNVNILIVTIFLAFEIRCKNLSLRVFFTSIFTFI